ncbi:Metallo-beta-lactamase superfamily lactonase [Abortiporus biennis]
MTSLPPPSSPLQAYCDVSVLHGGNVHIPESLALLDGKEGEMLPVPALSFLLIHSASKNSLLFDLGVDANWKTSYPPAVQNRIKTLPFFVDVPQDVVSSLVGNGCDPSTINYVCLSHVHWDHVGNTKPFTGAVFIVGQGALDMVNDGYPKNPDAIVSSDILPLERTQPVSPNSNEIGNWAPIGPFHSALDFFGDGSVYTIDAPGHCPGHINLLVRTSSDGGWLYLGGDSAHHRSLIKHNPEIPVHERLGCMHKDKELAKRTIARIKEVSELPRVRVIIAHDTEWYEENKDQPVWWPERLPSL